MLKVTLVGWSSGPSVCRTIGSDPKQSIATPTTIGTKIKPSAIFRRSFTVMSVILCLTLATSTSALAPGWSLPSRHGERNELPHGMLAQISSGKLRDVFHFAANDQEELRAPRASLLALQQPNRMWALALVPALA